MNQKQILRPLLVFIAAFISVMFLEGVRRGNKVSDRSMDDLSAKTGNFRTSNNNFIFFEAVSRYVLIAF
jgi:hypothetical protein